MHAFIVEVDNRPGEGARVTEALAGRGVNVILCAAGAGGKAAIGLIVDDEAAARRALADAGITAREVETVTTRLDDRPGQSAELCRLMADAGVNIELLLPVELRPGTGATVALGVDNVEAARRALGGRVTEFSYGTVVKA